MKNVDIKCHSIFKDWVILAILLALTIFWFIYGGSIPFMDGTFNFEFQLKVLIGGLEELFYYNPANHPPANYVIGALFMKIFGIREYVVNAQGYFYFVGAIFSIYFIGIKYGSIRYARIATVLLALEPVFVANSIFSMTDYMVAAMMLVSFAFYSYEKLFWWWLALSFTVFSKETAALLPISYISFWLLSLPFFIKNKTKINFLKLIIPIVGLLEIYAWRSYCSSIGGSTWLYFFDETLTKNIKTIGFFRAILGYIFTGGIFNESTANNYLHLFVFNFQWIITVVIVGGGIFFIKKIKLISRDDIFYLLNTPFPIMAIFFIAYSLTVLTLPTMTITRYVLPASVLMIFPFAYFINAVITKYERARFIFYIVGLCLLIMRLFFSLDFVSAKIWGVGFHGDKGIYVHAGVHGIDSFAYNIQFLEAARKRTEETRQADKQNMPIVSSNCSLTDTERNYMGEAMLGYNHLKPYCIPKGIPYDAAHEESPPFLYGVRSMAIDKMNNVLIATGLDVDDRRELGRRYFTSVIKYKLHGNYIDTIGNGWAKAIGTTKSPGKFYLPISIILDNQQNIYVADSLNKRIQKFTSAGEFESFFEGVGDSTPMSLSFDHTQYIYMLDYHNTVYKYNIDGKLISQWIVDSGANEASVSASGIAASGRNVFVGDVATQKIMSFSATTESLVNSWSLPDGFIDNKENTVKHLELSWDPDECILYVASISSFNILAFNINGELLKTINVSMNGAIQGITGMAYAANKDLYAIGTTRIREFRVDKIKDQSECN